MSPSAASSTKSGITTSSGQLVKDRVVIGTNANARVANGRTVHTTCASTTAKIMSIINGYSAKMTIVNGPSASARTAI